MSYKVQINDVVRDATAEETAYFEAKKKKYEDNLFSKTLNDFRVQRNFKLEVFLNNKAWFAASLIFFISHLVDIQYFDVRISAFCWILLAGLKTIIDDKLKINNFTNNS